MELQCSRPSTLNETLPLQSTRTLAACAMPLAVCILWATTAVAENAPRQEISLNGSWQYQKVAQLDEPAEAGPWETMDIPGTLRGYDYERVWFRRSFSLPPSMRGSRIKIRFDGVKYNSRIFVNGEHVGGCLNGYDAFEVDATDAVRFDGPNELAVGCHDWTGVFSPGKFDFSKMPAWQRPRRYVTDKVIAPIGGHYDQYGIWGDVVLVAHPAVYVHDLFIKPSVRNGELVVDYTVANESSKSVELTLRAIVEDNGRDALQLPTVQLSVPAGKSVTTTLRRKWPDARYWSHEDPYLYHLRTELSTGDVLRTRFGFREFWIEGHRYVLNGAKINLLASSWWPPPEPMQREEIEKQWLAVKAAGIVCFRTHTQPWRRINYDVADEVGLLMIIEGAMWHDPYCTAYDDPTFWDNYAQMIRAMMKREKNRPSVIMWSMENESYSGEEKTRLAVENLARVGKMAKQWDPTRPIYFESDGDPGGVADAIGMHYVHEYPKYTCWPNEAYWLSKPFNPRTWFGIESEPFVWKKDKPLYIGEFLWVPSGTPANHTVFFGDDAYLDLDLYTRLGKAEAWKMQILAFRDQEAGGMCPWTVGTDLNESNPLYRAHQYAYQPIAAYCHDYDRRFYSGEIVERRVEVFNDVLSPSELTFSWSLSHDERVVDRGGEQISLPAGDKRMLSVRLQLPEVSTRAPLTWRLSIERDGVTAFEDTHQYSVFPQPSLPRTSARLGLYDTNGTTSKLLAAANVEYELVESLTDLDSGLEILVIGDGCLTRGKSTAPVIGRIDPQRGAIMDFVARGGRVLVLRQDTYPEGLFNLDLTPQESTMTFPLRPSHPALQGLTANDLKFWRGDHMVADHETPRPSFGAAVSIVVSGSDTGIAHAPLLERPMGRGCVIHCQLQLVRKFASEPTAGVILSNLLAYCDHYRPQTRKTAVLGGDRDYCTTLRERGLRFDDLTDDAAESELSGYSLVICHGSVADSHGLAAKLRRFVEGGGRLLVHRPSPETMDMLRRGLEIDLIAQPYSGPVKRVDGQHDLLEAIAREDLYWTVKQPGESWALQPLSPDMVDGVFGPPFDGSGAELHEIESWTAEGQYVVVGQSTVLFASAGTAVGEINFDESGKYGIGIRARGTPCQGVYPIAELSVDDRPFGFVQLDEGDWKEYGVFGHIEKGRHTIQVAFINDASSPPQEDRNLEVDRLLVVRDQRADNTTFLTAPAAVATQTRGAGSVVFDRIRWDTEKDNGRKATRYACSLLTAMGADFTPRSAVTIECEQMTPQPDMNHFHTEGGTAYMGCNGFLSTTIQVAKSKQYSIDIVASGDASEGVCPLVEIHLDGQKVDEVQLTTEGWRAYPLVLPLKKGRHEFSLKFVNDYSSPSGDRNLRLDQVVFYND